MLTSLKLFSVNFASSAVLLFVFKRVPFENIQKIVDRLSIQKNVKIDLEFVDEANHIFSNHHDELINRIKKYLDNLDLLDS